MSTIAHKKRGRKSKPFLAWWDNDRPIHGLTRRPDGRWKVLANGQTFVEPDERAAVARFRAIERQAARKVEEMVVPVEGATPGNSLFRALYAFNGAIEQQKTTPSHTIPAVRIDGGGASLVVSIDSEIAWTWFREQLHARPEYVAQQCGAPGLVNYATTTALPAASIKLATLPDIYDARSGSGKEARRRVRRSWKRFTTITGYRTLRDLRTEGAIKFRTEMERKYTNAETRSGIYGALTAALTMAAREGKDAEQLRHAREVLKVLYVKRDEQRTEEGNANPIAVEDFRTLIASATDEMRALLLFSLNACMYLSEVLALEWDEINLNAGTYVSRRNKTRVIRTATLWPETVEALRALPRRGQSSYVFTSSHGTRFNVNSFRDKFTRFRRAVGVSAEYNQIRDGSYSASCAAGVDFAFCEILAGHKLPGQSGKYIARTPRKVAPACAAIHAEYAPFPPSTGGAVKIGRPRKLTMPAASVSAA